MRDRLDEYLKDPPPEMNDNHRSVQQAALQELIKLSAETVQPVESQIEKRYRSARRAAEEKYHSASKKIEQRFQELRDKARQQYEEQAQRIQRIYESDISTLETNTQNTRNRINNETEAFIKKIKKEFDHEVWLAETVAEETKKKLYEKYEKIKKEIPAARSQIDAVKEHADWLLDKYGQNTSVETVAFDEQSLDTNNFADLFDQQYELAQQHLDTFENLKIPRIFAGFRPYLIVGFSCIVMTAVAGLPMILNLFHWPPFYIMGPIVFVATLAIAVILTRALRGVGQTQIKAAYQPLRQAIALAYGALDRRLESARRQLQEDEKETIRKRDQEIGKAKLQYETCKGGAEQRRSSSLERLEESYKRLREEIEARRTQGIRQAELERNQGFPDLQSRYQQDMSRAKERYQQKMNECQDLYDSARSSLEKRWKNGLLRIEKLLQDTVYLNELMAADWSGSSSPDWIPPRKQIPVIRFGQFMVNIGQLAENVRRLASPEVEGVQAISIPALLSLHDRCSLLLQSDHRGHDQAIDTLRAVMLRLLISLPPGRVHFTILDPVGLGENFAGFMHLADYQESLVGGRIWTDSAHIEQQLIDLTNHMETVIQKYLRNEFNTIEEYNLQAGELAEPYRFLVIADFPVNFTEEAAHRLSSIINSGPRCGVYTLIAHDIRQDLPTSIKIEDLQRGCVHLVYENDHFVWQDSVFEQFLLTLDTPPAEEQLTQIMHRVGQAAKDSHRVEVPFETVTPPADQYWTAISTEDVRAPIGRSGAVRLQHLRLGRGVAQHMLIAGKTGSGKSTLLHVLITNLALWYSPDQVEFYLVDFKKGVEFKTYAVHNLPHARAVAIESDREFGLSVLQRLDREMEHRGDLFRRAGVQDLAAYRLSTKETLPRTLLIVDEFQMFFSEDDKLAQDASILIDRLVRQGRAFGIHVILGSQSLGGAAGLARSTIGQMAVRIALQCSESDSQLILDDSNTAARLLTRPGEAIYNDAGGLVEGNSPFQTAWLADELQDEYLNGLSSLAKERIPRKEPLIVFEGNAPADLEKNPLLTKLIELPDWPDLTEAPKIWLGEPVAIKEPTAVSFKRQIGANFLIVGQRDDASLALLSAALVGLSAQHSPQSAKFIILDGSPVDSPYYGQLQKIASILPQPTQVVEWRNVEKVINDLTAEVSKRQEVELVKEPTIYLLIYGLQRYRVLRRSDDDFSFLSDREQSTPKTDQQFAEILREGPTAGVHTLVWADTSATLERTMNRQSIREFDNRVLFQMSATDSSNLIDSPLANKLGFYRALFFSEEQGVLEKFRPYALLDETWLEHLKNQFMKKTTP